LRPLESVKMSPWDKLYFYRKLPVTLCLSITLAILVAIQMINFNAIYDPFYECNRRTLKAAFFQEAEATWPEYPTSQNDDGTATTSYYAQKDVLDSIANKVLRYYGLNGDYRMPGYTHRPRSNHRPHHTLPEKPVLIMHLEGGHLRNTSATPKGCVEYQEDDRWRYECELEESMPWTPPPGSPPGVSLNPGWQELFNITAEIEMTFGLYLRNAYMTWLLHFKWTTALGCGKVTGSLAITHEPDPDHPLEDIDAGDPPGHYTGNEVTQGHEIAMCYVILIAALLSIAMRLKLIIRITRAWLAERHHVAASVDALLTPRVSSTANTLHEASVPMLSSDAVEKEAQNTSCGALVKLLAWSWLVLVQNIFNIWAAALMLVKPYLGAYDFLDRLVLSVSAILTWAALCEFTNYIPRVNLFQSVFYRGGKLLMLHGLGISPLFLGFTLFGMVLYGPLNYNFHTFSTSAVTLFSVVLGDSVKEIFFSLHQTDDMLSWYAKLCGRIYLAAFIILFIFIVLNIATLVIEDAYFTVRTEMDGEADGGQGESERNSTLMATMGGIGGSPHDDDPTHGRISGPGPSETFATYQMSQGLGTVPMTSHPGDRMVRVVQRMPVQESTQRRPRTLSSEAAEESTADLKKELQVQQLAGKRLMEHLSEQAAEIVRLNAELGRERAGRQQAEEALQEGNRGEVPAVHQARLALQEAIKALERPE